jgi:hypothetical protein
MASAGAVVDRQLLAYNARDIDAYCALFAEDAVISRIDTGEDIARGRAAIREHYTSRFASPGLQCSIQGRIALGAFVIDHERVVGIGTTPLEVVAIYEVRDSMIRTVRFIWT